MKFGQYELRELIAVGGMAEVYKGRVVGAEGFEKYVAIKRILPDLAEDERFVKMLLTEARIHSALSHRNIVQIHDLGISEDGEYFIVLEYVEGYDLRVITDQITEQGEIIPEALSLHIASELAQGMHFAHELRGPDGQPMGIVHRDVSPSNVLISLAGEVKLSDFGLAKRRHDRSVVGSLKGNLAYMSPEQARQSTLDRRTDVFSLGAVLFEMLTGKRLREITDEIQGWNQVASGQLPSVRAVRPDLPELFERLLSRALAPDPKDRFPDAASFGTAIRAALTEMNTPVGPNDLQQLLSTLHPPRRPRALVTERSKVIRLGPEAQALGEAIAAPATPPPLLAPGMTPQAPRTPGGITNPPPDLGPTGPSGRTTRPATPAASGSALAARSLSDALHTPPPVSPLPPVQPWRATPNAPVPLTRGDRLTPPRPVVAEPARLHSSVSARALPEAAGVAVASAWGGAAVAAASAISPEPRPSTAEHLPTIAPPAPPALASQPRPRRETARVVVRGAGAWRPLVIVVAAALLLGAGAVHLLVLPLDVLVVWRKPATLTITSEPPGAVVKLDGVALDSVTPTQATVKRDRGDHVLQLEAPGHRPAQQVVRYDAQVTLGASLRLEKESTPTFEALPSGARATPPPAAEPAPAAVEAKRKPAAPARTAAPARSKAAAAKTAKGGKTAKSGKGAAKPRPRPTAKRK